MNTNEDTIHFLISKGKIKGVEGIPFENRKKKKEFINFCKDNPNFFFPQQINNLMERFGPYAKKIDFQVFFSFIEGKICCTGWQMVNGLPKPLLEEFSTYLYGSEKAKEISAITP